MRYTAIAWRAAWMRGTLSRDSWSVPHAWNDSFLPISQASLVQREWGLSDACPS